MRKYAFLAVFGLLFASGCVAVTARDNQLHVDRRHDVVVVGNRIFLINLKTGRLIEMRVPAVGETVPVSEIPPDERDCDEKVQSSSTHVEIHEDHDN